MTTSGQISANIQGVPSVYSGGQGGLLDVSLDPQFASNRYVYLSFSEPREDGKMQPPLAARNYPAMKKPAKLAGYFSPTTGLEFIFAFWLAPSVG